LQDIIGGIVAFFNAKINFFTTHILHLIMYVPVKSCCNALMQKSVRDGVKQWNKRAADK